MINSPTALCASLCYSLYSVLSERKGFLARQKAFWQKALKDNNFVIYQNRFYRQSMWTQFEFDCFVLFLTINLHTNKKYSITRTPKHKNVNWIYISPLNKNIIQHFCFCSYFSQWTQKTYFSQIWSTNLLKSLFVSTSLLSIIIYIIWVWTDININCSLAGWWKHSTARR